MTNKAGYEGLTMLTARNALAEAMATSAALEAYVKGEPTQPLVDKPLQDRLRDEVLIALKERWDAWD